MARRGGVAVTTVLIRYALEGFEVPGDALDRDVVLQPRRQIAGGAGEVDGG